MRVYRFGRLLSPGGRARLARRDPSSGVAVHQLWWDLLRDAVRQHRALVVLACRVGAPARRPDRMVPKNGRVPVPETVPENEKES
jgi:hypothetical protein